MVPIESGARSTNLHLTSEVQKEPYRRRRHCESTSKHNDDDDRRRRLTTTGATVGAPHVLFFVDPLKYVVVVRPLIAIAIIRFG